MNETAITALVSSRICHDLISPIGAISNGVELMSELNGRTSPELSLIYDSVSAASTKLRYFRVAFGAAPADAFVSAADILDAVSTMFGERFSIDLQGAEGQMSRLTAKALLLSLLCLEKSLPLGGRITANLSQTDMTLNVAAPRVKADKGLWSLLESDTATVDDTAPAEVQFPVLAGLIHAAGLKVDFDAGDETMMLSLRGFPVA